MSNVDFDDLVAKVEQIDRKKWRAEGGTQSDFDWENRTDNYGSRIRVFYGKTEEAVVKHANAFADKRAIEQARKLAAYELPLTRTLLSNPEPEKKEADPQETIERNRRIQVLNVIRENRSLTPEEVYELEELTTPTTAN